jgi:hypothetical protein
VSAQLKSFEGPDVQVLLDRIRVELGPGAKIDGAEKIRVGGVLGFFAKEHYRVVVEVPDPADGHAPRRAARPSAPPPAASDVFSAMAEATDDVNDVGVPALSAGTAAARTVRPPATRAAGPSRAAADPAAESFDAVLTRVATTLEATPAPGNGTGGVGARGGVSGASVAPSPDGDAFSPPPADIAAKAALFLAGSPTESGAPTPPRRPAAARRPTAESTGPTDRTIEALRRVGLDEATVAAVSDGLRRGTGLQAALLEALGGLAPAPPLPSGAGSLLVVVGAGVAARRLGAALAGEIGIDPTEVPYASLDAGAYAVATGSLLVRGAEDAAERAPGWRRSRAAVAVVDAPVRGTEQSWARAVITSLRPTAVWGLADSTTKTQDIAAWVETLGGVDALALENIGGTTSPAAVLGTGIPVARLDGQPATAARWVATVVDRVTPCT